MCEKLQRTWKRDVHNKSGFNKMTVFLGLDLTDAAPFVFLLVELTDLEPRVTIRSVLQHIMACVQGP